MKALKACKTSPPIHGSSCFHGSASILEHGKNVKLRQNQFHMKDTGKSSSRKLRRVICYTLYRMDPQKTHYKISFSATFLKIIFFQAEDGIRDYKVTGVQTCALPIYSYERYGEILFQKVASGHLLHFVQDGSSKHAL